MESNGWDWLEAVEPVAAPELGEMEPEALDGRLRGLIEKRESWDELFGPLALHFVRKGLARQLGFANLGQYLKERLGMSRRAVEQRVWLEKRMEELPQLRHALEQGEVSYEKARLVAGVADFDSVNQWIRRAAGQTCAELERSIDEASDAQACARGRLEERVPERVAELVDAALRAAGEGEEGPLDRAGRLAKVAMHFVETWGPLLLRRNTLRRRILERDGWRCQVPGCTRPASHVHHVKLRSQGGGNEPENLISVCVVHHLRGIHRGLLRVSGTAPDHLVWEMGVPPEGVRSRPAA
jgi:HNH endonuclease